MHGGGDLLDQPGLAGSRFAADEDQLTGAKRAVAQPCSAAAVSTARPTKTGFALLAARPGSGGASQAPMG
jgi:hypothetical protein